MQFFVTIDPKESNATLSSFGLMCPSSNPPPPPHRYHPFSPAPSNTTVYYPDCHQRCFCSGSLIEAELIICFLSEDQCHTHLKITSAAQTKTILMCTSLIFN